MAPPPPKRDDALLDDDDDDDEQLDGPRNPYASKNRWRHQESSAFARHAAAAHASAQQQQQPRDAEPRGRTDDLANFLNSTRVPADKTRPHDKHGQPPKSTPIVVAAPDAREAVRAAESGEGGQKAQDTAQPEKAVLDGRDIAVGPLLNYRRTEGGRWIGSVLVVTKGGGKKQLFEPTLLLRRAEEAEETHGAVSPVDVVNGELAPAEGVEDADATEGVNGTEGVDGAEDDDGVDGVDAAAGPAAQDVEGIEDTGDAGGTEVEGLCLYSDPRNTFWRFDLSVPIEEREGQWAYTLPGLRFHSRKKPRTSVFHVPAAAESMRIMFHSCNGFSVGTDVDEWSGPALWHDVLRRHGEKPFHVMLGGGDQIYNDGIRVDGPLRKWTSIGNPRKRREYPFPESLRQECDDYYLRNYIRWYAASQAPFSRLRAGGPEELTREQVRDGAFCFGKRPDSADEHLGRPRRTNPIVPLPLVLARPLTSVQIIDGFGSYVNEFMRCDVC